MKRLKISFFPILLIFSYMLIEGSFDPLWLVAFSLMHELGHGVVIRLLGGSIQGFSGGGQGFALAVNGLSYKDEILVAAAGPLTSVMLALGFGLAGQGFFCFANGALAAMNLLPILPLDGGRILRAVLGLYCPPHLQRRILLYVAPCCLLPLLALAFWQFLSSGYNISLLFVCIYLISLIKENGYDV